MTWVKKKEEFYKFTIENNVIGFFKEPLKLKSGRLSYWYINWRDVAEDLFLIDQLTNYVIEFVNFLGINPDCFFGVPEGATKLGIITQYKWAKNRSNYSKGAYILPMGRGKPKEHGDPKDRFFLGLPKGKVAILEDTTTTGESLLGLIKKLLEYDLKIVAAIGLTNRNEVRDDNKTVQEAVEEEGVKYYAMSEAIELLPKVYNLLQPGEEIGKHIENYFNTYGTKKIKLIL
jgi:orotate phosphoribosyltransferase